MKKNKFLRSETVENLLLIGLVMWLVLWSVLLGLAWKKNCQKQAECATLKKQIKLLAGAETTAQIASGAAHDLNNMLAGICGAAEDLENCLKDDAALRRCKAIANGCEQASRLARKMTCLTARTEYENGAINVKKCLEESLELLRCAVGDALDIVENFDEKNLWAAINSEQLYRLILNLGFNSRDAIDGRGRIEVGLRRVCLSEKNMRQNLIQAKAGEYVEISFADNGTGIDAENMPHIFEPFFTTKGKGTGLGLSVIYDIICAAGGSLRVENRTKGVCFYVFLPLIEAERISRLRKGELLSAKILVVDDDCWLRQITEDILKKAGCEAQGADGVEKALKICQKGFEPDVAILDVVLPEDGGSKLYEKLRQKKRQLKILFVSGGAPDEKIEKILAQDRLTAFLNKPFRAAKMLEILQILLAKA